MQRLKLTSICLLITFALWSCGGKAERPEERKEDEPMASGEIINRYVDTLTTAPGKARRSGEAVEQRTRDIDEAIGD